MYEMLRKQKSAQMYGIGIILNILYKRMTCRRSVGLMTLLPALWS